MLTVGSLFAGVGGFDLGFERAAAKVIWNCEIDAPAVSTAQDSQRGQRYDHNEQAFIPIGFHMTQDPITSEGRVPALGAGNGQGCPTLAVAYRKATTSHGPKDSDLDWERWEEAAHSDSLDAGSNVTRNAHAVVQQLAVRRLLPVECCRLQGFPDDWLDGLGLPDSAKYRMLGNAVAVPVVTWLAGRMAAVHAR